MNTRHRLRARLIPCWLAFAFAAAGAQAATDHAAHTQAPAQLELNQGKKWPTDAPLRQGMQNMRAAMQAALPEIHGGRLPAARYRELAGKIHAQIGYVVTHCKLAPQADAQLHHVIGELQLGAQAMEGGTDSAARQAGAARVLQALDGYGRHFDHPGWRPLHH